MVAGGSVFARALLLAAVAEVAGAAGQLAEQALPAGRTRALAVRVRTLAAVL